MSKLGIDISVYQGEIDLSQAMSEGVEFAIIKGGGGDDGLYVDRQFARNYDLAKSLKLPIGCYWFSRALTTSDAKTEAAYFYENVLKGRSFELPVYIDVKTSRSCLLEKMSSQVLSKNGALLFLVMGSGPVSIRVFHISKTI